ncbi:hypothetical protein GCM10010420_39350 [Streptomyces glaucosporus]|uniref:Secreted protein n=1 Tax=Streptomyces glaucosporus TaxID=284044 RepID=A0ABN3IL76_9ACTN
MIAASLAILLWLVAYAALCASQPFTPAGKLRLGRRAYNALRRIDRDGRR